MQLAAAAPGSFGCTARTPISRAGLHPPRAKDFRRVCNRGHFTMTTPDRAELNRRHAQKNTGPRTPEGKNRSRLNGLKHGLTAQTPVLPGEDPRAYQARLETWTADLQPRTDLERFLIERVV